MIPVTSTVTQAALKAGVKFIIKAQPFGPLTYNDSSMAVLHRKCESVIKESGLKYCFIHCPPFYSFLSLIFAHQEHSIKLNLDKDEEISMVSESDVAKAIAIIASKPSEYYGKTLNFIGVPFTMKEITTTFSQTIQG